LTSIFKKLRRFPKSSLSSVVCPPAFFEFRYYLPVACVPSASALTHITHSLSQPPQRTLSVKTDDLLRPFLFQLLQALAFLHGHGVVHRNLDISNVLFDERNQVKLSDYGMFELTGCGNEIGFIVGHALYLPPEVLFAAPTASQVYNKGLVSASGRVVK
jgi:serine/threonine protein kinase